MANLKSNLTKCFFKENLRFKSVSNDRTQHDYILFNNNHNLLMDETF